MFFARIAFHLEEGGVFRNLSTSPVELFTLGSAKCVAKVTTSGQRTKVILEYGGFETEEDASLAGIQLVRQIKLQMVRREISINISGGDGLLDGPSTCFQFGGMTEYGMAVIRKGAFFGETIPESVQLENDYIGLKIFEVVESLDEINFFSVDAEFTVQSEFMLDVPVFDYWDSSMDVSLSLLNASVTINDVRLAFLLRLMAIEALVPASVSRDAGYIAVIDKISRYIDSLEVCIEYKNMVKSHLGQFKEQSISQKVRTLLERYLSGKIYADMDANSLFLKCYRGRSSFVHSGSIDGLDIKEVTSALKQMALDLLQAISEKSQVPY